MLPVLATSPSPTTPPVSPPASVETARPSSMEITTQEKITPATPLRPSRPFFPSPDMRRRRPSYPPSGTQIPRIGVNQ